MVKDPESDSTFSPHSGSARQAIPEIFEHHIPVFPIFYRFCILRSMLEIISPQSERGQGYRLMHQDLPENVVF